MENQKDNSNSIDGWVFAVFGLVMLGTWLAPGISEHYRRVSQLPVVGEWTGEDDQTVIMAFGKDGWFEMRNHKGEGVPNMRYKIDYDEDPPWLDIIVLDKAGKQMLTIKCIMKHSKRERRRYEDRKDRMIIKFPVDYTQLLGHIPLDISRYDRPTSFSGQEENRIKLLRKATLAVPTAQGYTILDPDMRIGETPAPEPTTPAPKPMTPEEIAIQEEKDRIIRERGNQ